MHRHIDITVAPGGTEALIAGLERLDDVVSVSLVRGGSIKPPGDTVTVHALNRGMDQVLKLVETARARGVVSVATSEVASLIDPEHQLTIDSDVDEAIWEEMDASLRHQGQITVNFLSLMALGGAVAAAGLASDPVSQAITIVASSAIAPGFEPIAKMPFGAVLRRGPAVGRGLMATLVGYVALALGAALAFGALRLSGHASVAQLIQSHVTQQIRHPSATDILVSAGGALAGFVMLTAHRRHVLTGPLIAMRMIPAMALTGAALASGQWRLAWEGVERWALDVALICILGAGWFLFKQARVHHRPMMR